MTYPFFYKRVTAHSHKFSTEDKMLMLKDLKKIKPFERKPGKKHAHFEEIQISLRSRIDMKNLCIWREKTQKTDRNGSKVIWVSKDSKHYQALDIKWESIKNIHAATRYERQKDYFVAWSQRISAKKYDTFPYEMNC